MNVLLMGKTMLTNEFYKRNEQIFEGELLPSGNKCIALTAIRNCYSPLPPSEIVAKEGKKYLGDGGKEAKRLFNHIAKSGHCYDDKTEVLTNKGFVLFKDLTKDHNVAMVAKDGTFAGFTNSYIYVEHSEEEQEGFIYDFESQGISFGVTSKHRMFISPGRFLKTWELKEMQDINYREYRVMKVPNARNTNVRKTKYTNNQLELIGFFIGDGFADGKRIEFHLKKQRKLDYLDDLLSKCEGITEVKKRETYDGRFKYTVWVDFADFKTFYTDEHEKTLSGLHILEGEEFEHLFNGLMKSDGSYTKSNKTEHYCTTSKTLENELHVLFTINGIANKSDGFNRISIQKEKGLFPFVKDSRHPDLEPKRKTYQGKTYCVQVPTGVLVVRRNGKTLVCGNTSTMEHIHFVFIVEDLSRAALAQLTRHRHFGYSVKSQRYVRYGSEDKSGGFDFVVPETVQNATKRANDDTWYSGWSALDIYNYLMDEAQKSYDVLRECGVPAEDARMVLPNAATTHIVMSGSLRTILEFYSKRREGNGAQWEIAELAERMREAVIQEEPWTADFFELA